MQDNGVGIAPEVLPRIFDLFAQVDRAHEAAGRAGHRPGAGEDAGRAARRTHRGAQRGPGAGQRVRGAATLKIDRLAMRVLILDDNLELLESLALVVESAGHQVDTAPSAERALASQRDRPADGPDHRHLHAGYRRASRRWPPFGETGHGSRSSPCLAAAEWRRATTSTSRKWPARTQFSTSPWSLGSCSVSWKDFRGV